MLESSWCTRCKGIFSLRLLTWNEEIQVPAFLSFLPSPQWLHQLNILYLFSRDSSPITLFLFAQRVSFQPYPTEFVAWWSVVVVFSFFTLPQTAFFWHIPVFWGRLCDPLCQTTSWSVRWTSQLPLRSPRPQPAYAPSNLNETAIFAAQTYSVCI